MNKTKPRSDCSLFPAQPVMLVDDEEPLLRSYQLSLSGQGLNNLFCCKSGKEALEHLKHHKISVLCIDLLMPEIHGEELLQTVSSLYPEIPVIVVTATAEIDTAVRCIKHGAFDYIVKPVDITRLVSSINLALKFTELKTENETLRSHLSSCELKNPEAFASILTRNRYMLSLFKYAEAIAESKNPVLITGETGVGKELFAQSIHSLSRRKGKFCVVNIAGLDDTLFSDSLFGHKKGAFTGADADRSGLVETAEGGSLFFDEIGDLSPQSQIKLLRLIQENQYYPLGSDMPKTADVRIIAATNHDVASLQDGNKFRRDLFYRLYIHHVAVPPLRERKDDIPLLVENFVQQSARELAKKAPSITPELKRRLARHNFPGNIRELQSLISDAVSLNTEDHLSPDCFRIFSSPTADTDISIENNGREHLMEIVSSLETLPDLDEFQEIFIEETLKRTDFNKSLAANALGITRQTLHKWLKKMRF